MHNKSAEWAGWQVISLIPYKSREGIQVLNPQKSDGWHGWKAVEENPKVARDHIQEGNGIICKMLGNHPRAACQFLKNDNKREQDLKEEILAGKQLSYPCL